MHTGRSGCKQRRPNSLSYVVKQEGSWPKDMTVSPEDAVVFPQNRLDRLRPGFYDLGDGLQEDLGLRALDVGVESVVTRVSMSIRPSARGSSQVKRSDHDPSQLPQPRHRNGARGKTGKLGLEEVAGQQTETLLVLGVGGLVHRQDQWCRLQRPRFSIRRASLAVQPVEGVPTCGPQIPPRPMAPPCLLDVLCGPQPVPLLLPLRSFGLGMRHCLRSSSGRAGGP